MLVLGALGFRDRKESEDDDDEHEDEDPCVSESSSFCLRDVPGGKGQEAKAGAFAYNICERCRVAGANKLRDCFQSVTLPDKVAAPGPFIPAVLSLKQTLCYV